MGANWPLATRHPAVQKPPFSPAKELGAAGTAIPVALFAYTSHPGDARKASRALVCSCKHCSCSCLQSPAAAQQAAPPCRAGRALAAGSLSPCCGQPWLGQPLPSGAPRAAQPRPLALPELPLLFPRLCHRQFWDHLPISVACSLKLIICQCELGWDCAGLAGNQNLPSFQLHPAQLLPLRDQPRSHTRRLGDVMLPFRRKKKCPTN